MRPSPSQPKTSSMTVVMSQLELFQPEPARRYGMPASVARAWERAYSPEVEQAVLAVVAARPEEWLGWNDFRSIIDQYDIGCCFGHALGAMVRKGLIQEKPVYLGKGIGAEIPGSGNYHGFTCVWRAAAPQPDN